MAVILRLLQYHSNTAIQATLQNLIANFLRAGEPSPNLSGAPELQNEASSRPNLSGQPTTLDLVLQIRQHVLEMEAADSMLNNLNDKGIKSIEVYELIGRIMFQRRRWLESEIDIVLLDASDHV